MALRLIEEFEESLRVQVIGARCALDSTQDIIAAGLVTDQEGRQLKAAALKRYSFALRQFSDFVVEGKLPDCLKMPQRRSCKTGQWSTVTPSCIGASHKHSSETRAG